MRHVSRLQMITVNTVVHSFTELAFQLLELPRVDYLLIEVSSQDRLEKYFSRQRGHNDHPTAYQVPYSAATLVQQKSIYTDLKSINAEHENFHLELLEAPLEKKNEKKLQELLTWLLLLVYPCTYHEH